MTAIFGTDAVCCPDTVLDVCDACGGDGGFDDTYIGRDHEVHSDWTRCNHCDGKGFILIDAEPIEMEDLELPESEEAQHG